MSANLAHSGATDWSSAGGYIFNAGSKAGITIDSDTINAGSGSEHIYGDLGVVLPQLGSATGLVTAFVAYPSGEPGQTGTSNYNYVYGFGPFGSLHQWASDPGAPSAYAVDADTITGGAGNNVMFGEGGDDRIIGGSGNEQISGGFGFNTVSGGGGTNLIAFNRSTDTYISGGGNDIARSALDVSAGSSILLVSSQSVVGTELAAAMIAPVPAPISWTGVSSAAVVIECGRVDQPDRVGSEFYFDGSGGSAAFAEIQRRARLGGSLGALEADRRESRRRAAMSCLEDGGR